MAYGSAGRAQHYIGFHPGGCPQELLHGERIVAQQGDEGCVVRIGILGRVGGASAGQQRQRDQGGQDGGPEREVWGGHGGFWARRWGLGVGVQANS